MSTVKVFDSTGNEGAVLDLGFNLEAKDLNPAGYACAIRVLLQNWRQGTVGCKDRGQVSLSGRKPWRQKGTGRARAGTARSPLWRKGGVTFGPQLRTKKLKINRKQKRLCLKNLLAQMLESNSICCVDIDFNGKDAPRTKDAYKVMKGAGIAAKKGVLFLPYEDTMNYASFRNIESIGILSFDQPNVFDLSGTTYWMFLKKDLELFKDMVAKWI